MKEHLALWLGELPSTWRETTLATLCNQSKTVNSGLKETNLLSLSYGKIVRKDIATSTGLLPESFENYNIVRADDIVLRFTDLQNDQRSLRVGLVRERGIITSAYCTIRPSTHVDPTYLYFALHAFDILKGFYNMGSGVRQSLGWDEAKRIHIPFPPIEEQKQIVATLDTILEKIDRALQLLTEQIAALESYKKSLIFETVTKGLDATAPMKPSGMEWIGYIPQDWETCRLKDRLIIRNGKETTDNEGDIPVYGSGGVFKWTARKLHHGESILFGRKGTIDKPLLVSGAFWTVDTMFYSLLRNHDDIRFLHYVALCLDYKYVQTGSTLPSITQTALGSFKIPLPDLEEQQKISSYLDHEISMFDDVIALKREQLQSLSSYRQSVIFEFVTGKRRVSEGADDALR